MFPSLQASTSLTTAGIRRYLSLSKKLSATLAQWCKPTSKLSEPPRLSNDSVFKPKICAPFGVCVCGDNKDALHGFQKLQRFFKHTFWKKRKTKEKSEARVLLESGSIVVEFRSNLPGKKQCDPFCDDGWDAVMDEELQAIQDKPSPIEPKAASIFFYLGRVNYSTFSFGGLQLHPSELQPCTNTDGVLPLEPAAPPALEVFSALEVFKNLLDTRLPLSVAVWSISLKDADWPTPLRIEDPTVPVRRLPNIEEFIFWQGSDEEKKMRQMTEKKSRDSRPSKRRKPDSDAQRKSVKKKSKNCFWWPSI